MTTFPSLFAVWTQLKKVFAQKSCDLFNFSCLLSHFTKVKLVFIGMTSSVEVRGVFTKFGNLDPVA